MTKIEMHEAICKELNDLYSRKNADYGDSFGKTYREEGMAVVRIRLGDKYNRICSLTRAKDGEQKVKDESIRDTLMDLANYTIMSLIEMGYDEINSVDKADSTSKIAKNLARSKPLCPEDLIKIQCDAQRFCDSGFTSAYGIQKCQEQINLGGGTP